MCIEFTAFGQLTCAGLSILTRVMSKERGLQLAAMIVELVRFLIRPLDLTCMARLLRSFILRRSCSRIMRLLNVLSIGFIAIEQLLLNCARPVALFTMTWLLRCLIMALSRSVSISAVSGWHRAGARLGTARIVRVMLPKDSFMIVVPRCDCRLSNVLLAMLTGSLMACRLIWLALVTMTSSICWAFSFMTLMRCILSWASAGHRIRVIRRASRVRSCMACRTMLLRLIVSLRNRRTVWCLVGDNGPTRVRWLMNNWQFPLAGICLVSARGVMTQFLLLSIVTLPCSAVESMLKPRCLVSIPEFMGLWAVMQLLMTVCSILSPWLLTSIP